MNKKELINYIADNIDISLYDTICDLSRHWQKQKIKDGKKLTEEEKNKTREDFVKDFIKDFLGYIDLEDEDFPIYKKEDNDFWNNENKNGSCWCDLASEWADSEAEIYNYNLWQEAPILSDYIEDALSEFGYDEKRGMIGILQAGQYMFYEQLANNILQNIKKYIDEF